MHLFASSTRNYTFNPLFSLLFYPLQSSLYSYHPFSIHFFPQILIETYPYPFIFPPLSPLSSSPPFPPPSPLSSSFRHLLFSKHKSGSLIFFYKERILEKTGEAEGEKRGSLELQ